MATDADTLYWVWLQCVLGISSSLRTQDILSAFGGKGESAAARIYAAPDYERRISGVFTSQQIARLARVPLSEAETIVEECQRHQTHILTPQSADYPPRLLELVNHPLALYVKGSLGCLRRQLGIAIVGTRRADRKSVDIAARLSASLSKAGCVVVSGGALGIDSAAHRGALAVNGKTVAVLGCGLRFGYLMENHTLREQIAATGALVSEFPGSSPALSHNFPIRNRLISGMTAGTVVVEAGERSGSLITAECAAEQGRDVFAVPGDAFGSTYLGANKLIREGAKPVFSVMDVLEEYELIFPDLLNMRLQSAPAPAAGSAAVPLSYEVPVKKPKKATPAVGSAAVPLSNEVEQKQPRDALEAKLLGLFNGDALHVDVLCSLSGEKLGAVFIALTNLEIEGMVRQLPGRLYEAVMQ